EVALLEEGAIADTRSGGAPEVVRGGHRARVIAGENEADAFVRETSGQPLRLGGPPGRERVVGELDGARGIAQRLPVPDQEKRHAGPRGLHDAIAVERADIGRAIAQPGENSVRVLAKAGR